jgi:hypothetical protein
MPNHFHFQHTWPEGSAEGTWEFDGTTGAQGGKSTLTFTGHRLEPPGPSRKEAWVTDGPRAEMTSAEARLHIIDTFPLRHRDRQK